MADQHSYDVTIDGQTYTVNSPVELSDGQAYRAARAEHESSMSQADKNARLIKANAAPLPPTPTVGDEFTGKKMLDRGLAGLKGEAEGFAGGLAAPVALAYRFATHPVDTAAAAGKAALGLGLVTADALQHPRDTLENVKTAAVKFGLNPEAIGAAAGATGAAIATPAILRGIKNTRVGQAAVTGLNKGIRKVPIAGDIVDAYRASSPKAKIAAAADEMGVSPNATGATMDSMPATPVPDTARVALPYAHAAQRTADAADVARANAADLGVASDVTSPGNMPLGVGDETASLVPGARARMPVPVRLNDAGPGPALDKLPTNTGGPRSLSDLIDLLAAKGQAATEAATATDAPAAAAVSAPGGVVPPPSVLDPAAQAIRDQTAVAAPAAADVAAGLDSRIGGLPPADVAAPAIAGPQGVPAAAQTPTAVRALLDEASAAGITLTPPANLTAAERVVWLREELSKELMARLQPGMGSRKRGVNFEPPN